MNSKKHLRVTLGAIAAASVLAVTVFAASYDSSEDPIVSLSYLTDIFRPSIEDEYNEKIDELNDKIQELESTIDALSENYVPGEVDEPESETEPETDAETEAETEPVIETRPSATYEVIELQKGDCVFAVSACDIMLRAGKATCIAPDATQGLADYTDADEVYNGQALEKNHMCLIPRGDGRGISADSDSVFIMIRGEYTIVKGN